MQNKTIKGLLGTLTLAAVLALAGCGEQVEPTHFSAGDTITFDRKEIVLGEVEVALDAGEEIVEIPLIVTNITDEPQSFIHFYWNVSGPQGEYLDLLNGVTHDVGVYVYDIIEPGETIETSIIVPYVGDGTYLMEFGDFEDELVDIPVSVSK